MRAHESTDRVLIDLRDQRTDLAIRVSLLKDSDQPDPILLSRLQRDLEILDRRLATYRSSTDSQTSVSSQLRPRR